MNENEILKQCEEITKKIESLLDMDSNDPKIQILDELLKQEFDEIYKLISTSEKLAIDFFSTIKNDLTFDEFANWIGDELSLNFQSYSFADFFIQKYEEMDFTDTSSLLYLIRSIKPKIIEEPKEKEFYREFFYKKLLEGDGHLFYDMLKSLYDNRRFIYTPQKVYLFFFREIVIYIMNFYIQCLIKIVE